MLGSNCLYFHKSAELLRAYRVDVTTILKLKGYSSNEILVYLKAFDYFCFHPEDFDGATIVKDLQDLPHLDLDAMLHDYQYLVQNVAANIITKWKADWLYAKGQERKGKGSYSSFSRFVGLAITGLFFIPYARIKRGKIKRTQKSQFLIDYKTLMN
nr:hypothetical protein [uncultured Flavobacterium sp.]